MTSTEEGAAPLIESMSAAIQPVMVRRKRLARGCQQVGLFDSGQADWEAVGELPRVGRITGPLMKDGAYSFVDDDGRIVAWWARGGIGTDRGCYRYRRQKVSEEDSGRIILKAKKRNTIIRFSQNDIWIIDDQPALAYTFQERNRKRFTVMKVTDLSGVPVMTLRLLEPADRHGVRANGVEVLIHDGVQEAWDVPLIVVVAVASLERHCRPSAG